MKIAATAVAVAFLAAGSAHAGFSDTIEYSWEFSAPSAAQGETVSVTLWADLWSDSFPFYALAMSSFDIMVDDVPAGGSVSNNALHPMFNVGPFGAPGTIVDNDILGITAEQFPAIETARHLALYTFDYTIDDGTPRSIDFALANEENLVFTGPDFLDPIVPFQGLMSTGQLEVTGVPAPGALALLGLAGMISGRGRRRAARV